MQFLADPPDGPLIRLFDFDDADASRLCALLASVSQGTPPEVALHRQPFVRPVGRCELTLRLADRDGGIVHPALPEVFECLLSAEAWLEAKELAEPLARPRSVGYQWLT